MPPLAHGRDAHSSTSTSQRAPAQPAVQWQLKLAPTGACSTARPPPARHAAASAALYHCSSRHCPPWAQGLAAHSSASTSQRAPAQPRAQPQLQLPRGPLLQLAAPGGRQGGARGPLLQPSTSERQRAPW